MKIRGVSLLVALALTAAAAALPAQAAPFELLVNFKLDARGINFMPDWKVALADYVRRFECLI